MEDNLQSRSVAQKATTYLRESYAVDLRSLAVFRVLVALVVLADLAQRFGNATVHYSDAGILPRSSAMQILASDRWSFLFLSGSPGFAQLVIVIGMIAAGLLLVGWHTRAATIVLWIVVVSLQARNNHLTYGADTLMRLTLFWSMFLPLGAMCSFDQRFARKPVTALIGNVATFALIAQVAFMYLFTALLKDGSRWREDFDAVYYALGMRDLSTGWGNWLFLNAPTSLFNAFTLGTLWMEFAVPIMLLFPIRAAWLRMTAIAFVLSLHLGIGTTMSVGLFPAISIASIIVLLPSSYWAFVSRAVSAVGSRSQRENPTDFQKPQPVVSVVDRGPALVSDGLTVGFMPLWVPFRVPSTQQMLSAVVALAVVLALLWNVTTVSSFQLPEPLRRTAVATGLYQNWGMFAPNPRAATVWFVVEGKLASGEKVDLLPSVMNGDFSIRQPVDWDQSDDVHLQNERWRKYFHAIRTREDDRLTFAGYVCRTWNAENSDASRLETVTITFASAATLPNSQRAEPAYEPMGFWSCS